MSEEIVAIFAKAVQVRDYPSQGVSRIVLEVPVESHVAITGLLYGKDVLVTLAPPAMKGPYGPRRAPDEDAPAEPIAIVEAPPSLKARSPKGGPLSQLAGQWCKDPRFHEFLRNRFADTWRASRGRYPDGGKPEDVARDCLYELCDVPSRAELDSDGKAKRFFNDQIRTPFAAELANGV